MKRKRIQNIAGIILSLALFNFSCMDEMNIDKGHEPAPEGESYFSLQIKTGDLVALTRATAEEATKEELAVHSVRVVLYDGDENEASKCKVEYVFEFNLHTNDAWNDPADPTLWITDEGDHTGAVESGYIIPSGDHLSPTTNHTEYEFGTFAQRIKNKSYKMLVILNGRQAGGGMDSEIYKVTNKGSYLYQLKQAVSATIDPATGTIAGGKGILMTNHQGLVAVSKSQLTKTIDEAHASPIQVSVDRIVAKVTLQHASQMVLPDGIDPASVTWGLDVTNKKTFWMREGMPGEQTDPTMETLYARDPNFTVLSPAIDKSHEFNTFFNEYYLAPNQLSNQLGDYVYTLENTIDIQNNTSDAYDDQLTRVIVGYKYTPEGFTGNDNYYIYRNKVISQDEVNNYLNDPTYEIPGLTGLRVVLEELKQKNYPLNGTGTAYYETKGFRYCPKGQIYYIIPIQHFGGTQTNLGYYGVVRNNIYEITINSLTPPDVAGPYLSANIQVQPWALRGQTNTIGIALMERTYAPLKVYYFAIKENVNIYQEKWVEETGRPISQAPEYRTMMFPVGTTVRPIQCVINWSPEYTYSHSIPQQVTMSDDPEKNEIYLFYLSPGHVEGSILPTITVYFSDINGNLLNVRTKGGQIQSNPVNILMYPIEDQGKGYVYIRYLSNVYNLYSNNIEYKMRDQNYVAYLEQEISDDKISFFNQYYEEPVHAANPILSGGWSASQRLVIICQPQ